jgi:hypothetical protein
MILAFEKPVVGIDYHGVISDTNKVKSKLILEEFGYNIKAYNCDRTNCVQLIGKARYDRISNLAYNYENTQKVLPVTNIKVALKELRKHYSLVIITAQKPAFIPFGIEWLEEHNLKEYFTAMYSSYQTTKNSIVNKLNAICLIDDDEKNLKTVKKARFTGFHFHPTQSSFSKENSFYDWKKISTKLMVVGKEKHNLSISN